MRRGDHTHLPFGEGDMDLPACLDALDAVGFPGLVCVELSRESHRADTHRPARSLEWLRRAGRRARHEDLLLLPPLLPRDRGHERLRR